MLRKSLKSAKQISNKYLLLVALIVIALAFAVFQFIKYKGTTSHATGEAVFHEAESGTIAGAATTIADSNTSGGSYLKFASNTSSFQPSAPYYATFFYPWYKNPTTDGSWSDWQDNGHAPPQNWFSNFLPDMDSTKLDPATELYSSNNVSTVYWQLNKLKEAKQEVAISSWWGQGHKTDLAFKKIVTDIMNRADNPYPRFRWTIYYENEGFSNPTVAQIVSDLNYIKSNYTSQSSYLKINGKPVIFVYADATDGADMASRWAQAKSQTGFYVVLKVYSGYKTDPNQPDSWHQYSPAVRSDSQGSYSYSVSPGFWLDGNAPRLPRDLAAFKSAVSSMVSSSAVWKLTETWNEWGEGTSVEPADQVIQTTSGTATLDPNGAPFKNAYVDVLNQLLPPLE